MEKYAIIVAGGSGIRMGSGVPKQFLLLHNKPLLAYTVTAFLKAYPDIWIILVLPEQFLEGSKNILPYIPSTQRLIITAGGNNRYLSVQKGLEHVPSGAVVFVHDGVRCLVTSDLIQRCYEATLTHGNAIPAVAAVDTIRMETITGSEKADRAKVRIIQTPQTFFSEGLKKAYLQHYQELFTDDASVLESSGEKIHLVEGDYTNIKITRPIDLVMAEQILSEREHL